MCMRIHNTNTICNVLNLTQRASEVRSEYEMSRSGSESLGSHIYIYIYILLKLI